MRSLLSWALLGSALKNKNENSRIEVATIVLLLSMNIELIPV
ncbi:hypothetical protein GPAL_3630 [Glaciecola pallidula DSM 14239 = ACAM 615]|uniref:Uncharacterized protein n=1 Tax=Brumicola pallidula DSM 14239 = ACAM 615 TaxID=1121922 RepID=K6ZJG7_9ALTE|nr:hypothetical protein GPAL_3630 [Glaciecola pallidula DSM 14239 = ACAM 615]